MTKNKGLFMPQLKLRPSGNQAKSSFAATCEAVPLSKPIYQMAASIL
jgi:hypothetical protein